MEKGCKSTEYCRATFVALSGYFNVLEHQREVKDTQLSTAPVFGDLIEMLRREAHVSRLQIGLNEKDVSLLDELAEPIRRRNILHFLESFGGWTPKMNQTFRRLQVSQLHLSSVPTNGADVGAALLMQCPAIFGDLSDELRTDINLATSLLEGLALAGNSVF